MRNIQQRRFCILALAAGAFFPAFALDPAKKLTQYSMAVWTQQQGLPQDSVRAITQTTDGYLWLGTDEGLARFDGYDFVTFSKDHGDLPSNSISSLAADKDGSLWIGTNGGLTHYKDRRFRNYTSRDGMAGNAVDFLFEDHAGVLWAVVEGALSRFDGKQFTNFLPERDLAMTRARSVAEDASGNIYLAGWSSVARLENGEFTTVVSSSTLDKDFPICMQVDRTGAIWVLGTRELTVQSPGGGLRRFGADDGLAGFFGLTGALQLDRNGNVWLGAVGGLARVQTGSAHESGLGKLRNDTSAVRRLTSPGLIRCIFEDRDGNLWLGTNGGLLRLHDDLFTVYGKAEGLPSDEPNAVHPDRAGRVWIGFQDGGLVLLSGKPPAGMPGGGVFSIGETRAGDLLVAGRAGFSRLHDGRFQTFVPPDPLARKSVYDVAEDAAGRIWLAMPYGLGVLEGGAIRYVITSPQSDTGMYSVTGDPDGSVWAGSRNGLWHVTGNHVERYGAAEGLAGDHVRTLHRDTDKLWIGTFGGGLIAFRDGKFTSYAVKDGLLSDNVSDIIDDGESLWLSTTRGVSRVFRRDLKDFDEHRVRKLTPVNYAVPDGLREAQGSAHPSGGGGRQSDGSLWFVTGRGVALLRPGAHMPAAKSPPVHMVDMVADGHLLDWTTPPRVPPGSGRLQIRYAAIHLSAPERVRYSFRLEGLDADWVTAGLRRGVSYDNLRHGHYRFNVRAELPGVAPAVSSWEFDMLPHYYETAWFRVLCALLLAGLGWMLYKFRVSQIRSRFALVLQERARLAREIHDTLTQAFVGISSQLDVVESRMNKDIEGARGSLDLARRMSQHSLNEARRSVMDLRAVALDNHDLASALKSGSDLWVEGSGIAVDIDVKGESRILPEEVEHHVLRIAQEGVTNVLKHARANRIALRLRIETRKLNLQVSDDGCGFNADNVFASAKGHFGLIGMRERAERLGGELRLESHPGKGTQLDVTVPLS
jgi:ligand-binding sensor domain-containing protein/signal transduction histidine kinase